MQRSLSPPLAARARPRFHIRGSGASSLRRRRAVTVRPHFRARASPMTTVGPREFPPRRRYRGAASLEGLAPLAGNLEHAAGAIARLDTLLTGHPLAAAWGWRSRIDAVRRQGGSRRSADRSLASRGGRRGSAIPDGRCDVDHRPRRPLRRGPPRLRAVELVHAARRGASTSDRSGHRRTRGEPVGLTAARDRQSRARLARPRRRKTADARRTRAALARLWADARRRAAVDRCRRLPCRCAAAGRGLERRISRRPRRRGRSGIFAAAALRRRRSRPGAAHFSPPSPKRQKRDFRCCGSWNANGLPRDRRSKTGGAIRMPRLRLTSWRRHPSSRRLLSRRASASRSRPRRRCSTPSSPAVLRSKSRITRSAASLVSNIWHRCARKRSRRTVLAAPRC